ncbi:MAG: hypothetical protein KGJ02_04450 [Verrucomicrobiota bacterium]|nr:hypothetical protein [Verrucomicrobiota bacterium]
MPSNINPPDGTSPTQPTPPSSGSHKEWNPPPLTWMGMTFDSAEAKQLWNIISQNVNNQISHDKDKALEALRRLNPEKNPDL